MQDIYRLCKTLTCRSKIACSVNPELEFVGNFGGNFWCNLLSSNLTKTNGFVIRYIQTLCLVRLRFLVGTGFVMRDFGNKVFAEIVFISLHNVE